MQGGSINKYLSEFESLANRNIGLSTPFLLSCFIFGLALEIHREVQAIQPLTLIQAVALARLQEEKFSDSRRMLWGKPYFPIPSYPLSPQASNFNPLPPLLPILSKQSLIPFKRLSSEEMVVCREKGLCFNYNEKFDRSHKWSSKFFLLIADDDVPHGTFGSVAWQQESP